MGNSWQENKEPLIFELLEVELRRYTTTEAREGYIFELSTGTVPSPKWHIPGHRDMRMLRQSGWVINHARRGLQSRKENMVPVRKKSICGGDRNGNSGTQRNLHPRQLVKIMKTNSGRSVVNDKTRKATYSKKLNSSHHPSDGSEILCGILSPFSRCSPSLPSGPLGSD